MSRMIDFDPVMQDLNGYLSEQDDYDMQQEYYETLAECEFDQLNYVDLIEYQPNYDEIEAVLLCVDSGKWQEAKEALQRFLTSAKAFYVETRINELAQKDAQERANDAYLDSMVEWC